jgi:hypothetical protein
MVMMANQSIFVMAFGFTLMVQQARGDTNV